MPLSSMTSGANPARTSFSNKLLSVLMSVCLIVSMTVIPSTASADTSTGAGYVQSTSVAITDAPESVELNGEAQTLNLTVTPATATVGSGCGMVGMCGVYCNEDTDCYDSWDYCTCDGTTTKTTYVSVVSVADESVATATASGTTLVITPAEGAAAGATTTVQVRAQFDAPNPTHDSSLPNAYGRCSETYTITVTIAGEEESGDPKQDEKGYYQLYTEDDLNWFADYVNEGNNTASARLMNDIALTGALPMMCKTSSADAAYAGTFDGNGYAITNITSMTALSTTKKYYALFCYLGADGTIENLTLDGTVSAGAYAVGVFAYNAYGGTISNCVNSVDVSSSSSIGGILYANATVTTAYEADLLIEDCVNEGNLTSTSTTGIIGGIVASTATGLSGTYTITRCVNEGTISNKYMAGGIVGKISAARSTFTLSSCINRGSIQLTRTTTSTGSIGGIVGYSQGNNSSGSAKVKNCYNQGEVVDRTTSSYTSAYYVGGIMGVLSDSYTALIGCFNYGEVEVYDGYAGAIGLVLAGCLTSTAATNLSCSGCYALESGDTSTIGGSYAPSDSKYPTVIDAETMASVTFAQSLGDDFQYGAEYLHPLLAWETAPTYTITLSAEGTSYDGTTIEYTAGYNSISLPTIELDKYTFGGWVSEDGTVYTELPAGFYGNITLTADLQREVARDEANYYLIYDEDDLNWFANYVNNGNYSACARLMNDIELESGVLPLLCGTTSESAAFNGAIDGDGYTISGITSLGSFTRSSSSYAGLVGVLGVGGSIEDLTLEGSVSTSAYVGVFAALAYGGVIRGCVNKIDVSNQRNGVGGMLFTTVYASTVGTNEVLIVDCVNQGALSSSGSSATVGGIVASNTNTGVATVTVKRCANEGALSSPFIAGGIIATWGSRVSGDDVVTSCINRGSITLASGGSSTGGLNAGGIIGREWGAGARSLTDCYNTGAVTAAAGVTSSGAQVGGIIGAVINANTVVARCFNYGTVSAADADFAGKYGSVFGAISMASYAANLSCTTVYGIDSADVIGGTAMPSSSNMPTSVDATTMASVALSQSLGSEFQYGAEYLHPLLVWETAPVYTVTYAAPGTSLDGTSFTYVAGYDTIELASVALDGYTFVGWEDADGNVITELAAGVYGNMTLTASYEPIVYTVTLDANGGTVEQDTYTYTVETGLELPDAVRAGYDFLGWYDGDTRVESVPAGTIGDIALTAAWSEPIEYTVTLDANGGELDQTEYTYNVETSLELPEPMRAGYTFTGWVDEEGNAVEAIAVGETGDVNLVATWSDPIEYTVTLDLGEGELEETELIYNVETGLELPTPTREGYTFTGWVDEEGNVVDAIAAGETGDVALTATWVERVVRLSGTNRYATMAAVSEAAFPEGCETVIVCRGDNFPDALSAAGLAGVVEGQVLLTKTTSLTDSTAEEIVRLGASKVYVIGSEESVSADVLAAIEDLECVESVERVYGSNRYETAVEVYKAADASEWGNVAIVATGTKAADALSVSTVAYAEDAPIFLANKSGSLPADALAAIEEGGFTTVLVLGGTGAVSAATESAIADMGIEVTRLEGSNRYETSIKIANWAIENAGFTCANVAVTAGNEGKYADALAASALCGKSKSPVLLVNSTATSNAAVEEMLGANSGDVLTVFVLGDAASVTDSLLSAIEDAVE